MAICRAADSGLASPEPIQLSHFTCRAGSGAVCARIGELSHCTRSFDNRTRTVFVTMRQTTSLLRICAHSKLHLEFECYGHLMGRLLAFLLQPQTWVCCGITSCVPLQQPLMKAGLHGRSVVTCLSVSLSVRRPRTQRQRGWVRSAAAPGPGCWRAERPLQLLSVRCV